MRTTWPTRYPSPPCASLRPPPVAAGVGSYCIPPRCILPPQPAVLRTIIQRGNCPRVQVVDMEVLIVSGQNDTDDDGCRRRSPSRVTHALDPAQECGLLLPWVGPSDVRIVVCMTRLRGSMRLANPSARGRCSPGRNRIVRCLGPTHPPIHDHTHTTHTHTHTHTHTGRAGTTRSGWTGTGWPASAPPSTGPGGARGQPRSGAECVELCMKRAERSEQVPWKIVFELRLAAVLWPQRGTVFGRRVGESNCQEHRGLVGSCWGHLIRRCFLISVLSFTPPLISSSKR